MSASGSCACGGVRYRVQGALRSVANCHCEPCRRITGHFMAATATNLDDLHVDLDETLRWYQSTPTVQYGFCGRCGSTLFWRASGKPRHVSIAAGTLDQPTGLDTTIAIHAAEAGDYHRLDTRLETHPGDVPLSTDEWPAAGQ